MESNSIHIGFSLIGRKLLNELVLNGLSGDFKIINKRVPILKAFEIVNVIKEGKRIVGFWAKGVGITRDIMRLALSHNNLKVIIWPGGSVTAPKAFLDRKVSRNLQARNTILGPIRQEPWGFVLMYLKLLSRIYYMKFQLNTSHL